MEGSPTDSVLAKVPKKDGEQTFFRNRENAVTIETWGGSYFGYGIYSGIVDTSGLNLIYAKPHGVATAKQYLTGDEKGIR